MNKFGVTPEEEPEDDGDKKTAGTNPAQRKLNMYQALYGNILK